MVGDSRGCCQGQQDDMALARDPIGVNLRRTDMTTSYARAVTVGGGEAQPKQSREDRYGDNLRKVE